MSQVSEKTMVIPEHLIYEMDEGRPIYYRGYMDVVNQVKTAEQIMGSGVLQSLLIELIKDYLKPLFGQEYVVLSSELGLQFSKKSWRNADVAVFRKKDLLRSPITSKHASIPPLLVVEVDTKAALEDWPHPEEYYHRKTDQLLDFGVQQVLWIFTATEKFMTAEKDRRWETGNWTEDIALLNTNLINIQTLLDDFLKEDK